MDLIETHAHLDYADFQGDLEEVIARAAQAGVTRIITVGTGIESSRRAVGLAERFPAVFAVVGIHPTNVEEEGIDFLADLRELARHPKVAAIGETGIDHHHLPDGMEGTALEEWKTRQAEAFGIQLGLAAELGLNVVIHQRSAWEATLDVLRDYTGRLKGVFHCFGGTPEEASQVAALGHLVSFTGIITFKNAEQVRLTAAMVPPDGYMVETDCPYLAPVPYRGKRAEPAHTLLVAEKIAEIRNVSLGEVAEATTRSAESFFRLRR